ncbi:MAG: pyridoxamine 5'-phosphate oxidase family protein [Bacilli bacterium]|nr:pyridoxamine 5'-phosphate oxidase family protein [Bacilli bacterium]
MTSAKVLFLSSRRGVLALNGDDGYPYAIPINYYYDKDTEKIYFHGSRVGHKVDTIRSSSKVCFTVYGNGTIKNETWAPFMQSVVVFGKCHILKDTPEKNTLLKKITLKYYHNEQLIDEEITRAGKAAQIYKIDIEHLSGKEIQER